MVFCTCGVESTKRVLVPQALQTEAVLVLVAGGREVFSLSKRTGNRYFFLFSFAERVMQLFEHAENTRGKKPDPTTTSAAGRQSFPVRNELTNERTARERAGEKNLRPENVEPWR